MEREHVREQGIHRKHAPVNPRQRKGKVRTTQTKTERQSLEYKSNRGGQKPHEHAEMRTGTETKNGL